LPKAPTSTHPLDPPARASARDFPCRTSSRTIVSALNTDGCPKPVRMIRAARSTKASGLFSLTWIEELGWSSLISSITSSIRNVSSLTPSEPSSFTPPVLIWAKSV
jgi:hypothetical protein